MIHPSHATVAACVRVFLLESHSSMVLSPLSILDFFLSRTISSQFKTSTVHPHDSHLHENTFVPRQTNYPQ